MYYVSRREKAMVLHRFYFFRRKGRAFGGLSMKYPKRSVITYATDRSCSAARLSTNSFISLVVRNVICSLFSSFFMGAM